MRLAARRVGRLDRILLQGCVFHARHGVHDVEKELGQRFVVDVSLGVHRSDDDRGLDTIRSTLNYANVYDDVRTVVVEERHNLIETLCERIARTLLDKHDEFVRTVKVRVAKPHVALPGGVLDGVAVEIEREQDDDHT